MHKQMLKRSTLHPLTQKRTSPHLLELLDREDEEEQGRSFCLPSLQRNRWKEDDSWSWDKHSVATSASWSQGIKETTTCKLMQWWDAIEKLLYGEDEQGGDGIWHNECMQWKAQVPHLRIIGISLIKVDKSRLKNADSEEKTRRISDEKSRKSVLPLWDTKDPLKKKLYKKIQKDVLDKLLEYTISELFSNNENETDSLNENLSEFLKITPVPISSTRCSTRLSSVNLTEERLGINGRETRSSVTNRLSSIRNTQDPFEAVEKEPADETMYKKEISSSAKKEYYTKRSEKIYMSQTGRNKLGTVFNEKIVVSPVPFAISTKESFSTLKTIPVRFTKQSVPISASHESTRNLLSSGHSIKRSTVGVPNVQSAWEPPVCPTVWPKNLRLAPIKTSKISSKNRSLTPSPLILQNHRKPLSPISRPTLLSTHAVRGKDELLEIRGKEIFREHLPKSSSPNTGRNYSSRSVKNKKRSDH